MTRRSTVALLLGCLLLAQPGCARYRPEPLDPAAHAGRYRARSLSDSALLAWVERHAGAPADGRWTDRQLGAAALAYRADLERARRQWLAARASAAAAGARPGPGVEGEVERRVGGRREGSPWVVSLAGLFTFELGGKRGARLQAARARETAAEAELALLVAATLGRVRGAALALRHAEETRAGAAAELQALGRVETLERARYAEAALGSGEVARTAAEVVGAAAAAASAETEVLLARSALAGALAVPDGELDAVGVATTVQGGCAWGEGIGPDSLAALALRRRGEIARALAAYAGAEADLRSRIAATYPDLELGPGFIWDQGVHRWTLAAALPALLNLRHRGPIDAAEAARHAAAAGVSEVQDELFAETGKALAHCRGAVRERAAVDSQRVAAERVAALAREAYGRGEAGTLQLARAELLLRSAEARERAARQRLERAGLELELTAAEWRGAETVRWPDLRSEPFIPREEHR
ncbi:MAG TPA: TolC family protein [Gemmatimonadales bacterium]